MVKYYSLNPLKRVNSILTGWYIHSDVEGFDESQSPQAGQFNSYKTISQKISQKRIGSQSPQAGQFNSYKIWCGL